MPRYVRPVGQWAVYSNYGGALLGVLAEDVSGESMEVLLRKRLFTPLGMEQTQLVRRGRSTGLATPYQVMGPRRYTPLALEGFSDLMSLSMGIESTAHDMGRFLRFLLTGKDPLGNQLLSQAGLELMRFKRFSNHPHASGFGMILDVVRQTPSLNLYMHNGATRGFSSHLLFIPDHDLGVFVSVVGSPSAQLSEGPIADFQSAPKLMASFVRELVTPYDYPEPGRPYGKPGRLAGHYLSEKRPKASPEAVFSLVNLPMYREVTTEAGSYTSNGRSAEEVAANVFRFPGPYAYREMFGWHGDQFYMAIYGSMVLIPVPYLLLPQNFRWLLGLALLLLATAPLTVLLDRRRGSSALFILLPSSLSLAVIVLLGWSLDGAHRLAAIQLEFQRGELDGMRMLAALCQYVLLTAAAWMLVVGRIHGRAARLHGLVVSCAGLLVAFGFWHLNLIGEGSWWLFTNG